MKRVVGGKDKQQVKTEARSAEKPCIWGLHLLCASSPWPSPAPLPNSILFASFSSSFRSNSCVEGTPLLSVIIGTHFMCQVLTIYQALSWAPPMCHSALSFLLCSTASTLRTCPPYGKQSVLLLVLVSSSQESEPRHPESLLGFIVEAFLWKLLILILYKHGT